MKGWKWFGGTVFLVLFLVLVGSPMKAMAEEIRTNVSAEPVSSDLSNGDFPESLETCTTGYQYYINLASKFPAWSSGAQLTIYKDGILIYSNNEKGESSDAYNDDNESNIAYVIDGEIIILGETGAVYRAFETERVIFDGAGCYTYFWQVLGIPPEGLKTFKGSFNVEDFKLYFNGNGGNVSTSSKNVQYGKEVGTLPMPTRAGYIFDGWYTEMTGGEKITETSKWMRAYTGNGTSNEGTLYAHWQSASPSTPSQKQIKVDKSKHTITLSWGIVKNADKIEILRSVDGGSYKVWKTVSASKTSLSFSEKSYVGTGKKYKFKLRAYRTVDGKKLYSGYSKAYSLTYGKFSAPKAAIKVTGANAVKISWKKIYGAKGYVVYRATSKKGTYKKYKTVKSNITSFKDTKLKSGKTYYYKVAAYTTADKKNIYGSKSSAVKRKIIGKLKNPVQKEISLNKSKKTFTISWKQVKNADKIVILRKVDNGKFKEWKTLSAKKGKATYSYTNFSKGHSYTFRLKAYYKTDGTKIESGTSNGYTINK